MAGGAFGRHTVEAHSEVRPGEWTPSTIDPAWPAATPGPVRAPEGATGPSTRVLVVDDHLAFAESIAMIISARPDLECPGIAASIADGLRAAERTAPDVILLDVVMPDGDGVDAIDRFRDAAPGTRILVLTGHLDLDVLTRAAAAGASGFLQKESNVESIIRAIRAARDGTILVEQATLTSILGRVRQGTAPAGDEDRPHLTAREMDVLSLMGEGLDPHAIAQLLEISLNTCRGYQKSLMAKLDAHSQLEAVVIATRRGIIRPLTG
jgi:DNA-binding NarL/FixJ family response regulator